MVLRRESGIWIAHAEPLWPGYVLAMAATGVTQDDHARLGASGQLSATESALLDRLCGPDHVIPISEGVIEGGRLRVQFGPLAGLEPLVRRIDRHRRLAWLDAGSGRQLAVGLEVTAKS